MWAAMLAGVSVAGSVLVLAMPNALATTMSVGPASMVQGARAAGEPVMLVMPTLAVRISSVFVVILPGPRTRNS